MGDFDLNVDSLIQRLLENFKKQKEAEEHAQKLLIAQQMGGNVSNASTSAGCSLGGSGGGDGTPPSGGATASSSSSTGSGTGTNDPFGELTEQQRRMLLQEYSISPPSETMISADGDQITVHHPREEPKKSRLKLRDFFVAEFGIQQQQLLLPLF